MQWFSGSSQVPNVPPTQSPNAQIEGRKCLSSNAVIFTCFSQGEGAQCACCRFIFLLAAFYRNDPSYVFSSFPPHQNTPFPVQKTCRNIGTACYLAATIYNIQDNLDLLFAFHLLYLRREFRMQFYLWLQLWAEKKHIVSSLPEGSFATNEHVGLQSF